MRSQTHSASKPAKCEELRESAAHSAEAGIESSKKQDARMLTAFNSFTIGFKRDYSVNIRR
jgi:hypothetical protein